MKNIFRYILVGVFAVVMIFYGNKFINKQSSSENIENSQANLETIKNTVNFQPETIKKTEINNMPKKEVRANGLILEDLTLGTGAMASCGKNIEVNYLGTLTNGTKFDSSYDRNKTFSFNLCAGEVIRGWDEGVQGMKVGGKRRLEIPAALGYGDISVGTIPANSTLVFEVELVSVK